MYNFCHPSVLEFMQRQPDLAPAAANREIAESCLRQCIDGSSESVFPADQVPLREFYQYAAMYWPEHVKGMGETGVDHDSALKLLLSFVFDQGSPEISLTFLLWLQWTRKTVEELAFYDDRRRDLLSVWSEDQLPIFTACQFGLSGLVRHILESQDESTNVDVKNVAGHTGFYLACVGGYTDIARMLHRRGADPNASAGWFGNAMQGACFHGHIDTVKMLLEAGASPKMPAKFDNALGAAFRAGRTDVAIVLLGHNATIKTEQDYLSALQTASEAGLGTVVEWLMRPSFAKAYGVVQTTSREVTMVLDAVRRGNVSNLKLLLQLYPNNPDLIPKDAIAVASQYGHAGMVTFLHNKGFSPTEEGQFGSPLRSACLSGNETIALHLLDWGVDVNALGQKGNALQAAAMKGHAGVVRLLIRRGAYLDDQSPPLGAALHAAAFYGHREVVRILLDAEAVRKRPSLPQLTTHALLNMRYTTFPDVMYAAVEGRQTHIAAYLVGRVDGYRSRSGRPSGRSYGDISLPHSARPRPGGRRS